MNRASEEASVLSEQSGVQTTVMLSPRVGNC
jgi:hypothetical protein